MMLKCSQNVLKTCKFLSIDKTRQYKTNQTITPTCSQMNLKRSQNEPNMLPSMILTCSQNEHKIHPTCPKNNRKMILTCSQHSPETVLKCFKDDVNTAPTISNGPNMTVNGSKHFSKIKKLK